MYSQKSFLFAFNCCLINVWQSVCVQHKCLKYSNIKYRLTKMLVK